MIAAAIAIFLFQQDGQKTKEPPKSLYETCIKVPTGNSAFEDYLRAADAINTDEFNALTKVVIDMQMNRYQEVPTPLPDWAKDKTILDVNRIRTSKFEPALKWIEEGNRKPLKIPPELILPQDEVPWIYVFEDLARLSGAIAQVHFADDDPAGATNVILENLVFSENIRSANVLHDFVGINCERNVFSVLNSNLTNLGESGWERILETVDRILKEPTPLIEALANEKEGIALDLHHVVQTKLDYKADPEASQEFNNNNLAIKNSIIALSDAERNEQTADAIAWAIAQTDKTIAALKLPEYKWPFPGDPFSPPPQTVFGILIGDHARSLASDSRSEMRNRTELRLLYVNGLIQLFRMRNGQLPNNLKDLNAPDAIQDQLTGKEYVYDLNRPRGQYQVYSPGRGDLGRIDMFWIREYKNRKEETGLDPDKPELTGNPASDVSIP